MIAIVPVTAMPYAEASALEERKARTTAIEATMSIRFTAGT